MRTIHQYEASDIDFKDPVHGFLMGMVGMVLYALLSTKPQDGESSETAIKRIIAEILNHAAESGITITKTEVPTVFKSGFATDGMV
jgi:hypothetical protein